VQIKAGTTFIAIAAGDAHSLAIDSLGNLWAWGRNAAGQLGDGKSGMQNNRHTPALIKEGKTFVAVAAAGEHSLAIDSEGNLWAWGGNEYGQLGTGDATDRNTPTHIAKDKTFKHIAAGAWHSLAIDSGNNLRAWGRNNDWQLGDGTTTESSLPIQIADGTKFKAIAAGVSHNHALDLDGNLWAWGKGILGNGATSGSNIPVKIDLGETTFDFVSAGASISFVQNAYTLAIDKEGNLWAWGYNSYGQLGDGTKQTRLSPVQIQSETKFITVFAGSEHSHAVDERGNLWAWGDNSWGQLGDGTEGNNAGKLRPVQINRE